MLYRIYKNFNEKGRVHTRLETGRDSWKSSEQFSKFVIYALCDISFVSSFITVSYYTPLASLPPTLTPRVGYFSKLSRHFSYYISLESPVITNSYYALPVPFPSLCLSRGIRLWYARKKSFNNGKIIDLISIR